MTIMPLHFEPSRTLSQEAVQSWVPMVKKKTSVVFMAQIDQPFSVATNEGTLTSDAGNYLAHDPVSGHFWPVESSYVEAHYEAAESGVR